MEIKSKENRGEYMKTSVNELKNGLSAIFDVLWMVDLNSNSIDVIFDRFRTELQDKTLSYTDFCEQYARQDDAYKKLCSFPDTDALSEICIQKKAEYHDLCLNVEGVPVWYRICFSPYGEEEYDKKIMITIKKDDVRKRKEIFNSALSQNFDYVIYLNTAENTYIIYPGKGNGGQNILPSLGNDYDNDIIALNKKTIADYDTDRVNAELSRSYIRRSLMNRSTYEFYSDCLENGEYHTKVIRMSLLNGDPESDVTIITCTDVTDDRNDRRMALTTALENTTIHNFCFYIKENRCEFPERTIKKYGCKSIYTNMPYSFMNDFVCEEDWRSFAECYDIITSGSGRTSTCIFRTKDRKLWLKQTLTIVPTTIKDVNVAIGIIENITDQKKMMYRAERDLLTGLYNKTSAMSSIQRILQHDEDMLHVMFVLDLDNFKLVNDIYGHTAGDQILSELGAILRSFFRSNDIIARFGGDEFILFIPNIRDRTIAVTKARKIIDAIKNNLGNEYPKACITASIGIAYSHPGLNAKSFFELADKALYKAKKAGKDRFCIACDVHSSVKG